VAPSATAHGARGQPWPPEPRRPTIPHSRVASNHFQKDADGFGQFSGVSYTGSPFEPQRTLGSSRALLSSPEPFPQANLCPLKSEPQTPTQTGHLGNSKDPKGAFFWGACIQF